MEQRLIDANALRAKAVYMHGFGENKYVPLKAIENAPAADVEVVKHCTWKYDSQGNTYCSGCFSGTGTQYEYDYCPNCGAHMDLEVDG